jgi:hypothetical protein
VYYVYVSHVRDKEVRAATMIRQGESEHDCSSLLRASVLMWCPLLHTCYYYTAIGIFMCTLFIVCYVTSVTLMYYTNIKFIIKY